MRHNQREQEPHNSQIDDCYKRKARRNNPRAFWRRRWDSNPRAGCPANAFRVRPVMAASVRLRLHLGLSAIFVSLSSFH